MTAFSSTIRLCVLILFTLMSRSAIAGRIDTVVRVGTGQFALDLELSFPERATPRAIVVIVPGSGGLSDPYFDREIQEPTYAYLHRGGLTDALTQAGFAVAAYSVRGYRGTSCIPSNSPPEERAQYFVSYCTNQDVRGSVSLSDISDDTRSIFSYLRHSSATAGLQQIAIAYSEGMFHMLDTYSSELTDPVIGIVAVGGPYDSLRSTLEYQLTREAYFRLIENTFAHTASRSVSVNEIIKTNGKGPTFNVGGLVETMGGNSIEHDALNTRQAYWRDGYHQLYGRFAPGKIEGTMDGVLDGVHIEKAWSIKYYSQLLSDGRKPAKAFRRFKGTMTYLYGLDDVLVRIPTRDEFIASEKYASGPRHLMLVDGADHGLSAGGLPSAKALSQIVDAVDAASARAGL